MLIFKEKKELFDGLAIEQLETKWEQHPVLHLDLNAKKYETAADLIAMLNQYLEKWEAIYGNEKKDRSPEERFSYVIEQASFENRKRCRRIGGRIRQTAFAGYYPSEIIRRLSSDIKSLLWSTKSADAYLRFVFLTGVTKFSQVSVFSDLNQLNDISLDYSYATLCGITREELKSTFEPEIEVFGHKNHQTPEEVVTAMERNYDGYHFHPDGAGVFNPFSVLNAFSKLELGSYWFQTGTPTFLVELLQKSEYDLRTLLNGIEAPTSSFAEYRMDANNPVPLIYQSGYLTIKDYDRRFNNYLLDFPNDEVRYGFINFLVPFYTPMKNNDQGFYIGKFIDELEKGDYESFLTRLEAFFADIPYELNDQTERHYQVIFYLVFKLMGQFTEAEVRSTRGRADAMVKTPKYVYVFEFKLNGTAEEAMKQIDEKGYLIPYQKDHREIIKIGVEFSAETRNINRWLVETR